VTAVALGIGLCFLALVVVAVLVLVPKSSELNAATASDLRARTLTATDRALREKGWYARLADRLELAGVTSTAASYVTAVTVTAAVAFVVGVVFAVSRGGVVPWLAPPLLVALVIVVARTLLASKLSKRQALFAEQLDDTLQLMASGLRAGHSLPAALDAVALEAESPTSEEFARLLNKHRIGYDLGQAMTETADRMASDDLAWTAQAVAIHREVGGNLGEVLDHVGETIRERNHIRRQVSALSAEGRFSANILIGLPIVIALVLLVVSPGYLTVFVTTPVGWGLIAGCLVLFGIGIVWLRNLVKIRF
jgi:tight adherence protein B